MRVSVDEAWKNRDRCRGRGGSVDRREIPRQFVTAAKADDTPAFDSDPSVLYRRCRDGQDPRGLVDDQCPVRRAFFSAALRAAYLTISGGRLVSPSARATASSSIRGTARSRKMGSPRIS